MLKLGSDGHTSNEKTFIVRKNAGIGFTVGGILTMLITTASQTVYPTFSTRNDAISTLGGLGAPTAIVWDSAIVIAGVLWLFSTYRLFHTLEKKSFSIPFYLTGIGLLLVGLSPWNLLTLTHTIGALTVAFFGAISCLAAWRITRGQISIISLAAGIFSIFALFGSYIGLANLLGSGGVERMIYYPILLWEIGFGGYLLGQEK